MAKKKRRSLSPAQKAALAKGRAKLHGKGKRTSKRKKVIRSAVPERLEPIIIKGEKTSMAKRKSRKAKRYHGFEGKARRTRKASRYHGLAGGKKSRRARRYHGAPKADILGFATDIISVGAGAVGASFVAQKIPVANAKIKALIPIALGLGIGLTKFGRNRMAKSAAGGMIAVGTLSLVKQFFPTVPLLSGADDAETVAGAIDALPDEEKALLGYVVSGVDGEVINGEDDVETYGVGVLDAPLSPDSI